MGNKVVVGQPAGDWPDDWFEGENAAATDEIRTAIEGVASHDPTTFVRDARVPRAELLPELWDFNRFKELSQKHAMASSAIASMVYKLVPKHCTESEFWRAYWCHVHHVLATAGFQGVPALNQSVLMRQDDMTSNAIIGVFDEYAPFTAFSTREMEAIIERDALDDEKLAAGIKVAIERGVIEANPPVEPVTKIDVMGKSAEEVAQQIISALGDGAQNGCVVVLQGLSGTGKGTTVDRVKHALPNAVTWSNGNVFRALTLLTVTRCQQLGLKADASGKYEISQVLTPEQLKEFTAMLEFGQFGGKWDIQISGLGMKHLVSEVANTLLKDASIGKHIPLVAEQTQGEVISFAAAAAAKMGEGGSVVLMEGRAPTLEYVRTPHRFELIMSDPLVIGKRRAAQRMMASAADMLKVLPDAPEPVIAASLLKALNDLAR